MIDLLYNCTRKSWLKALSFLLATATFMAILLNAATFSTYFGGKFPLLALLVFYAMATLWIHGIGFEFRSRLYKALFLPLVAYSIVLTVLITLFVN